MSDRLTQVAQQIADIEGQITPLAKSLESLRAEHRKLLSAQFIEVNGITRDAVEMSSGDGKPWFWTCYAFHYWMKENSTKQWAEWNTQIYRVSPQTMSPTPATMGELR